MLSAVLSVVVAVVCAVLLSVAFHMFVRLLLSLWWRLRPPRNRPSWGRTSDAEDLSLVRGVTRAPPRNVTCLLSVLLLLCCLFLRCLKLLLCCLLLLLCCLLLLSRCAVCCCAVLFVAVVVLSDVDIAAVAVVVLCRQNKWKNRRAQVGAPPKTKVYDRQVETYVTIHQKPSQYDEV